MTTKPPLRLKGFKSTFTPAQAWLINRAWEQGCLPGLLVNLPQCRQLIGKGVLEYHAEHDHYLLTHTAAVGLALYFQRWGKVHFGG